jgi:hypothetical protein
MDALESEINEQVAQVRTALRQARAAQDDYLADLHQAELDGLARTAAEHGVPIHGGPSAHSSAEGRVVDLTTADFPAEPGTVDLTTLEQEQRSA